jgi:hypothetical protein
VRIGFDISSYCYGNNRIVVTYQIRSCDRMKSVKMEILFYCGDDETENPHKTFKIRKMLTCALKAQVNKTNIEIAHWNVCITFNF